MRAQRTAAIALATYRHLSWLLPARDQTLRADQDAFVRRALQEASAEGGIRAVVVVATACHLDLFRRAAAARRRSRPAARRTGSRAGVLDTLAQDTRHAWRSLAARPLLSLGILLTLALGIGANAAIFSVVDTILRRPLPFADDHELVRIYQVRDNSRPWLSPRTPLFLELHERSRSFAGMVGQRFTTMRLTSSAEPVRVIGGALTPGWMEVLGIAPTLGRVFSPEEEARGRESGVVVLAHAFWQDRHGGDPGILGEQLELDGQPFTVIGVLPPGFAYPYSNDLYFPLDPRQQEDARWALNIQARLRDGVSLEQAQAELSTIGRELAGKVEGFSDEMQIVAIPTRRVLLDDGEGLATGLLGAVGFLLLIACANVGALLLARSSERGKEMALRAALGAPRHRQIRLLLTESMMISLAAGALGAMVAAWTGDLLRALLPGRIGNVVGELPFDGTLFLFTFGVAVVTGLLFGLPLALRPIDGTGSELRAAGRSVSAGVEVKLLDAFVVAELALVLALLAGAGAMLTDLAGRQRADLGFDPDDISTISVSLTDSRYADPAERRAFADSATAAIRQVPGVESAGATTVFPTARRGGLMGTLRPWTDADAPLVQVNTRLVTPGFIEAIGLELMRGRLLEARDLEDTANVAVLAETAAQRLFGSVDPVGQQIIEGRPDAEPITVVGVVNDVVEQYQVDATWYLPYAQHAHLGPASTLILTTHAAADPDTLGPAVRRAVWSVDPSLPLYDAATARELREEPLAGRRFGAWLTGGFAAVGLLLGAIGLYSLVAFGVARRRPEIAIRVALGARPGDVVRRITVAGMGRVAWGSLLGVGCGALLVRWLATLVPGVELNLAALIGVAFMLAVVGLTATWIPARRAARVDPASILRSE